MYLHSLFLSSLSYRGNSACTFRCSISQMSWFSFHPLQRLQFPFIEWPSFPGVLIHSNNLTVLHLSLIRSWILFPSPNLMLIAITITTFSIWYWPTVQTIGTCYFLAPYLKIDAYHPPLEVDYYVNRSKILPPLKALKFTRLISEVWMFYLIPLWLVYLPFLFWILLLSNSFLEASTLVAIAVSS